MRVRVIIPGSVIVLTVNPCAEQGCHLEQGKQQERREEAPVYQAKIQHR